MSELYREAAKILRKLEGKLSSLKSLVFSSRNTCRLKKKLYALVFNTVKSKTAILKVMEECSLLEKEPKLGRHLCMVLVYDLLLGKGIQCGGPYKRLMMKNKKNIMDALNNTPVANRNFDTLLPKYARVNLLKVSVEEVISLLKIEGYSMVSKDKFLEHFEQCSHSRHMVSSGRNSQPSSCTSDQVFCQDALLDYVLLFCPCSLVTFTSLYNHSQLILQDKASCLPAYLLAPLPGAVVIDACAAPGNKTTHLASILNNIGIIHAFDKDEQRYITLTEMVRKVGAVCVKTHCEDFLKVTPTNFPEVEYILVDPSCSGSGIVNRIDYGSRDITMQRLKSLSRFQKRILKHALSFPNVKRVVYSTCSIHSMENEAVVQHALSHFTGTFDLVPILPNWTRRGESSFLKGSHCVRLNREDLTNGFFVAVFERLVTQCKEPLALLSKRPKTMLLSEISKLDKGKQKTKKKARKNLSRHIPVTGN